MSDTDCKTLSSSTNNEPMITSPPSASLSKDPQDNNSVGNLSNCSSLRKTKTKKGSLTPHELKHHSLWAYNVEIEDKSLPEFPSTQTTKVRGETRLRTGKGEKGEEKQNETSAQKSMKDRVCGLQTLHLAHNSFSGKVFRINYLQCLTSSFRIEHR